MKNTQLDKIVARHDLNTHPFYQAWRAGTLPRAALAAYACEYAPFIETIELGWSRLGDDEHAAAERGHAQLWNRFRDALGSASGASCAEAKALSDEARRAFADPVEAIGALYAFEAQQPSTARSKLDGLSAHYALPEEDVSYFRLHADDYGEREQLSRMADGMSPTDAARADAACERMCQAMWLALDGLLRSSSAERCRPSPVLAV